jgi:hypothetical protein
VIIVVDVDQAEREPATARLAVLLSATVTTTLGIDGGNAFAVKAHTCDDRRHVQLDDAVAADRP